MPIPELVEVARKVGLELRNRLSVHSSRSLVGLHTLEGFPDLPLGDRERLCLVHGLLPLPVGPWPRLNNAAPSLQPHYRAFVATTGCSAPARRVGTLALAVAAACGFSLRAHHGRDGAQVLTFHTRAWSSFAPPTRRMPLGPSQAIPRAGPAGRVTPRFRHRLIRFRRFCSGSLALASLDLAGRICPNLDCNAHHHGF